MSLPFPVGLCDNLLQFDIKKHTKFDRILSRVNKELQTSTANIIFHGIDKDCEKCISLVEVLKKKTQIPLFQWNIIRSTIISSSQELRCEANTSEEITHQLIPEILIMISKKQYTAEHQCSSQQTNQQMHTGILQEDHSKKKPHPMRTTKLKRENKWKRQNRTAKMMPFKQ